jgi:hypothetical protein
MRWLSIVAAAIVAIAASTTTSNTSAATSDDSGSIRRGTRAEVAVTTEAAPRCFLTGHGWRRGSSRPSYTVRRDDSTVRRYSYEPSDETAPVMRRPATRGTRSRPPAYMLPKTDSRRYQ